MGRKLSKEQSEKRDTKRAKFKSIAEQIDAMSPADRDALARSMLTLFTVEGRALSDRNRMMVALQKPSATLVGGFRQWLQHGRVVRKGETGLSIWVPVTFKGKAAADGAPAGESSGEMGFICGTVFDVSQTEICEPRDASPAAEPAAE